MWETVGISEHEARVYETLIPLGQAPKELLSARTNLTTTKTTQALTALIKRGLVTRSGSRPPSYSAVEPSLAGSVLISKREHELRQLQQHLNELDETFRTEVAKSGSHQAVEVIEGAPRIWRAFVRVQRLARRDVRAFDKPPYFVPPGEHGDEGPNLEERQFLESGAVSYRVVYDQESVALPGRLENVWDGIRAGEQARVASAVPVKLVASDDKLAILSSAADFRRGVAYLVHESSVLDLTLGLFEAVWHRAVPLGQPDNDQSIDDAFNSRDQQLLGLLASGATDSVIARSLGMSMRTVQRNIHELMDQVGARTRFQIGMEACRRGWL